MQVLSPSFLVPNWKDPRCRGPTPLVGLAGAGERAFDRSGAGSASLPCLLSPGVSPALPGPLLCTSTAASLGVCAEESGGEPAFKATSSKWPCVAGAQRVRKAPRGSGGHLREHELATCLRAQAASSVLGCRSRSVAAGGGRASLPSTPHWPGCPCAAVSSGGLSSTGEMRGYWRESSKGPRR